MTRLTDVDALIDKYQSECGVDVFRYEVIEDLCNAPTEDVAPVRHGKWLRSPEDGCFRCSECGMPSINYQNYCCRCGARMVEDE